MTAASLPAAKDYFTAEQQMGIGRFSAAMDALRDAVRRDTSFAVAYYRMSHAAELIGDDARTRDAAAAAGVEGAAATGAELATWAPSAVTPASGSAIAIARCERIGWGFGRGEGRAQKANPQRCCASGLRLARRDQSRAAALGS